VGGRLRPTIINGLLASTPPAERWSCDCLFRPEEKNWLTIANIDEDLRKCWAVPSVQDDGYILVHPNRWVVNTTPERPKHSTNGRHDVSMNRDQHEIKGSA